MKKQPVLCFAPNPLPGMSPCALPFGHKGNHAHLRGSNGWTDAQIGERLVAAERELRELHIKWMTECRAPSPIGTERCDRPAGHTGDHTVRGGQEAWAQTRPPLEPIAMILHCPMCNVRHIDQGRFATKLHHTHACQGCGHVWRPAIVDTVGVQFLPGFKDAE